MIKTYNGKEYESNNEYLQSKHWRATSGRFLRRNKDKGCCICHRKDELRVRRKRWKRNNDGKTVYGRERFRDLQLICVTCQEAIHINQLDTLMRRNKIRTKEELEFWIQQRKHGNRSNKPKERHPIRLHSKRSY